jgi:hypothetical protein
MKRIFKCDMCDYKGAMAKYLRRHIDAAHESVPHPCQECDYVGKTIKNMHEQVHQIFYCDKSDYSARKKEFFKEAYFI